MKLVSIAAISVMTLGLTSVLAYANPFMAKKLEQKLRQSKAPLMQKSADCTDFTGTWTGTCVDSEGESYETDYQIEQWECQDISFGDEWYTIGGVANDSTAYNPDGGNTGLSTSNNTLYLDWNTGKTDMVFRSNGIGRQTGQMNYNSEWNSSGRFSLVGDQMVTFMEYFSTVEFDGTTQDYKGWQECTLDKVSR